MQRLPAETQRLICTCSEQCKRYVTIDSLGRFCEYEAREIALGIFELVEDVNRIVVSEDKRGQGYTYEEDQLIIKWYNNNDRSFKHGDTPKIAAMLNRELKSVRNRIKYMRRMGML